MCRHLGYLGPTVQLDALLLDPEHSLLDQATAPRFQIATHDNPHGFGVGWYVDGRAEPERYRTVEPMWADDAFATLAASARSGAVLAAVRNATPGSELNERGNAPFAGDGYLFSHNGFVRGYRDGVDASLRAHTSERRLEGIEGDTDSETLFALVLDRLDTGAPLATALVDTVRAVHRFTDGPLNLLAIDGRTIAATALGNSLYTMCHDDTRVVASEPYDDHDSWMPVADNSVVVADAGGIHISPIPED